MDAIMRPTHFIRQVHAPHAIPRRRAAMHHLHMNMREAIGAAIRRRRKAKGLTQRQLGDAIDLDQGGISRIEKGEQATGPITLEAIAGALDVRVSRLMIEADSILDSGDVDATAYQLTHSTGVRHVPLISWVNAGRGAEAVDSYARGKGEDMIRTEAKVGRLAYALRVDGHSMTNPAGIEPTFPSGQIIIVDPHRDLVSGALIVARYDNADLATFKRYVEDGPQKMLVPINPQFPVIQIDRPMAYCGTVVAKAEMAV